MFKWHFELISIVVLADFESEVLEFPIEVFVIPFFIAVPVFR